MAARPEQLLQHIRRFASGPDQSSDGDLLARFVQMGDEDAFTELVRRHGPMVLAVCRRVLGDAHRAEDAFQATFLILARKAAAVRHPEALAAWLRWLPEGPRFFLLRTPGPQPIVYGMEGGLVAFSLALWIYFFTFPAPLLLSLVGGPLGHIVEALLLEEDPDWPGAQPAAAAKSATD